MGMGGNTSTYKNLSMPQTAERSILGKCPWTQKKKEDKANTGPDTGREQPQGKRQVKLSDILPYT